MLDYGVRPFVNIALSVGFAVLYYVLALKVLISVFKMLGGLSLSIVSDFDSIPTREAAFGLALTLNHAMILGGLLSASREPEAYLDMFLRNSLFVIVPAFMFFTSRNVFITVKDAGCLWHKNDTDEEGNAPSHSEDK